MPANLDAIAGAARLAEQQTGCPGLLLVAQCGIESAWLLQAHENNCFGIKTYSGCYGRQLLHTTEWFDAVQLSAFLHGSDGRTATLCQPVKTNPQGRNLYDVQDWFATFATLAGCFAERGKMWDQGIYAPAAAKYKQDGNLEEYVRAIAVHYSTTDPTEYANLVMQIISESAVQDAWRATMAT
jgi:flagellum-specific peptidoglycan hydrolase FlgJ